LLSRWRLLLSVREKDMADMRNQWKRVLRHVCRRGTLAFIIAAAAAAAPAFQAAHATEPVALAVAGFDFVDTSGEAKVQTADHARRLTSLDQTVSGTLAGESELKLVALDCSSTCSAGTVGLESLARQALQAGASHLLIGQVRKMSTLIGGVKFAVIDLGTNSPTCDRFLSYRGDTDEAWSRAAAYTARDVVKHCLP